MFSFKSAGPVLALSLLLSAGTGFAQGASPGSHEVELEGELEVLVEDYKDHAVTRHFLKSGQGRTELRFKGRPTQLATGAKLRVKGQKSGEALEVAYLSSSTTSSSTTSTTTDTPTRFPTYGAQKTLVILVNFQDRPSEQPWTPAQVGSLVFGSVSDYYKENSYQQAWLTGEVHGWHTIAATSTTCDQTAIANQAKSAASAAGANLSAYSHLVYLFPYTSNCNWAGSSTVGGSPSQAWINGKLELKVVGHELGHSFGLEHSLSLACDGSSPCQTLEYGDGVDVMGWSPSGHFNAYQKERLGWLNGGSSPPMTIVEGNGTYVVEPLAAAGTQPKALKILKSTDPATGWKTWYFVEFRQAVGYDSVISSPDSMMNASNVLNGVVIHTGPDYWRNTSVLLDMTPETYQLYTRDPALVAGRSFTDPDAGITITTSSVGSGGASVSVSFSQASNCVRANPSIAISPSQSTSVAPGTAVNYTATVTNKDNAGCGTGQFGLSANVPSGWTASVANPTLSLSPGASASTTLTVTSSASTTAGSYTVWVNAANSALSSYAATTSASYSVAAASALNVSLSSDKTSYSRSQSVKLAARVLGAGGAAVANASVSFTLIKANGATVTQQGTTDSTGTAVSAFRLKRQDPAGMYQGRVNAGSGSQATTASTSFSVQ